LLLLGVKTLKMKWNKLECKCYFRVVWVNNHYLISRYLFSNYVSKNLWGLIFWREHSDHYSCQNN
jgi:hypothetical protein